MGCIRQKVHHYQTSTPYFVPVTSCITVLAAKTPDLGMARLEEGYAQKRGAMWCYDGFEFPKTIKIFHPIIPWLLVVSKSLY